ncbi:hypothetical protein EVG20_g9791 [Dentipellis fragilis]|uniref:Uncharacterized protein n=1 Tax=Dentipellis fragilis TaxID=205917 RepID=A0A4Y9XYL4_9AGAM|nr:hypothetical protein EVG20_g9791 [Dentipellis fragilis]
MWLEEIQIREDARQPVFESGWREEKYVDDGDCCVLACHRRFNWRAKHRLAVGGDAASTSSTSSPLSLFLTLLPSRAAWRVSRSLSYAYFALLLQTSAVCVHRPPYPIPCASPPGTFSPADTHLAPSLQLKPTHCRIWSLVCRPNCNVSRWHMANFLCGANTYPMLSFACALLPNSVSHAQGRPPAVFTQFFPV